MDNTELSNIVETRLGEIKELLVNKGKEYAREDIFSNFNQASKLLRITKEEALLGFVTKHTISIVDLIQDINHNKVASIDIWREKISDVIVYMLLLEAMVIERKLSTRCSGASNK